VPVQVLEHPADIRLRAWGHSLQSVILEVLNYTLSIMYGSEIENEVMFDFSVEFHDRVNLVPKIVNEAIFQAESTGTAGRVRRLSICPGKATAQYIGERMREGKQYGSSVVKAATYDRLVVSENPPLVEITLDI
jgi:SHS2 domain-containing protein